MSSVCSAVVHATAWSYGCFAELKENTEGTTNGTKGHENSGTIEYTDYTDYLRTTKYTKHTKMPRRQADNLLWILCEHNEF